MLVGAFSVIVKLLSSQRFVSHSILPMCGVEEVHYLCRSSRILNTLAADGGGGIRKRLRWSGGSVHWFTGL